MLSKDFEEIRRDLMDLQNYWVVIFGGYLTGNYRDIDVCVITKTRDNKKNRELLYDLTGRFGREYDIKIFELMPLNLKGSVINNYMVLFGDKLQISEYFYFYRKLWDDNRHRLDENRFEGIKEKLDTMRQWREIRQRSKFIVS